MIIPHESNGPQPEMTKAITALFAFACGATTANVYYAQSIAGSIAASLHIQASFAGLIVTATQLGYGLGLFFIVGLADLVDNRRLVLLTVIGTVISLLWVAVSTSATSFLIASVLLGICTVGSQILVPLAVHLSSEARRGQVIGSIMGGLVTGIMLSRPLASFLTGHWGWRAIFLLSAAVMLGLLALLVWKLPGWKPQRSRGYLATLRSTLRLLATVRPLQRRAAYQGTLFAVFNLFWTAVPLMLHDRFGFDSTESRFRPRGGGRCPRSSPCGLRGRSRAIETRHRTCSVLRRACVSDQRLGTGCELGCDHGCRGPLSGWFRPGQSGLRPACRAEHRPKGTRSSKRWVYDRHLHLRRDRFRAWIADLLSWWLVASRGCRRPHAASDLRSVPDGIPHASRS